MTTRGLQPEHISCLCLVCYRHVSWAPHRQTSPSRALWIKHLKHLFSLYLLKRRQTIKVYITDQKEAGTYNTRSVYNFSVIHFNWLSILTVNMWPSQHRVDLHADGLQGVLSPFQDFHCKVRHGAILTIPPMWSLAQSLSKDQDMHLSAWCWFVWPQTNTSSSFSRSDPEASSNKPLRPESVQGSPPSQCAKIAWPWRHPCQLLLPISWAETPTFLSCRPH